jgi:hypothetical protein
MALEYPNRPTAYDTERCLFYVACTRARDRTRSTDYR